MAGQARAFEMPSEDIKEPQKEKKTADVIPFKRPAVEAEENAPEKNSEGYAAYHTLGGCLTQEEYETAMEIAGTQASINEIYVMSAKTYAGVAGLVDDKKLSDEVLRLYAVLRDYHNTPGVPDKLAAMSDPQLLAEVLRMKGESAALKQLTTAPKLKHIFGQKN